MDSSPVLRHRSLNKICSDSQRIKNESNKKQVELTLTKFPPCFSDGNIENKAPAESCQRPPLKPGLSRLPVLAKNFSLQKSSDFTHNGWEAKPLRGKSKKKKTCTRPVPFNFSQPKSKILAAENRQPLPPPTQKAHSIHYKRKHCNGKSPKQQTVLRSKGESTKVVGKVKGKMVGEEFHLPDQSGSTNIAKTPLSSLPCEVHQNKATQPAVKTEICLDDLNLLSLQDGSKTSNAGQAAQLPLQSISTKPNAEVFQTDPAALLSILQNEGVSRVAATPKSKTYNFLPQRVSVLKSQQKPGPITGSVKSMPFSPDPAALHSILLNEGVKDRDCPSGRSTSIYLPQRVAIKKKSQDATASVKSMEFSPDPAAFQSILLNEGVKDRWLSCSSGRSTSIYTPQRVAVKKNGQELTSALRLSHQQVRNTKVQPVSNTKCVNTPQNSQYLSRFMGYKNNLQPCQEKIVQRLFDDPEEEEPVNVVDKAPEDKPLYNLEANKTSNDVEEQKMFEQAPPRESVIFFSTGKKFLRVPRFENLESSVLKTQHDLLLSDQREEPVSHHEIPAKSEPKKENNPSAQHLHREVLSSKSVTNPAIGLLRKRLPPLEDLLLDEEVATYTFIKGPAASGFVCPRPRCENPLASFLHFEDSTRFIPIGFDPSTDCLHGSPRYKR